MKTADAAELAAFWRRFDYLFAGVCVVAIIVGTYLSLTD